MAPECCWVDRSVVCCHPGMVRSAIGSEYTADTRTSRYTKSNRHANYMLVSEPENVITFTAAPEPEVSDHRILMLDV